MIACTVIGRSGNPIGAIAGLPFEAVIDSAQ